MPLSAPAAMGLVTPKPLRLEYHAAQFCDPAVEVHPCPRGNGWFTRYDRFVHSDLPPVGPSLMVLMYSRGRLPAFYALKWTVPARDWLAARVGGVWLAWPPEFSTGWILSMGSSGS